MLWGKHPSYMKLIDMGPWLKIVSKHIDIVATVETDPLKAVHTTPHAVRYMTL